MGADDRQCRRLRIGSASGNLVARLTFRVSALANLTGNSGAFLDSARRLGPEILGKRDETERERRLPSTLVEQLRAQGLFHLWLPKSLGGAELHPEEYLAVVEELARAEGAVGWCAANGSVFSLLAGSLSEPVAREIFGDRAIMAGSVNPLGRAVVVEGGYLVSGRWAYGSGIAHCDWTLGNCVVHDENGPRRTAAGAPEMRFMLFPAASVEIIDTWRVGGLRGTGSHDFSVDSLFVPAERTLPAFVGLGVRAGALYRMPIMSLFCVALAAVPLGLARAAIDAFLEIAGAKVPVGSQSLLRDKPLAQYELARAEAMVRAARAGLVEAVREQWGEASRGEMPTLIRRAGIRLATTYVAETSLHAIEIVYNAAGGSAIQESGRLDRCFRDARVAVQHIGLSTNAYELAGKVLLGLDLGTPRF